jgi:gluconate:H+ symporter, GntP family
MSKETELLLIALAGVVALVLLIARFKVNAFVALMVASVFVGLASRMKPADIAKSFQDGMGATLGGIAVVIGLGTILGKFLAESGGAAVVANALIRTLGRTRLPWATLFMGFIVGIPVFFGVGVVLLTPILFALCRETKEPLLRLGFPMVVALSLVHCLVPPHPGPMAVLEPLAADAGKTILWSLLVALPCCVLAMPMCKFASDRLFAELGGIGAQLTAKSEAKTPPGLGLTLFTILLPVLLMLVSSGADVALAKEDPVRSWAGFIGHPAVAMLVATLFAFFSFGFARGFDATKVLKFSEECLGPAALTLLVVGAGGGFNRVLDNAGASKAIAALFKELPLSPLLLAWLVTAVIRTAVGSATVSIITAAGLIAPMIVTMPGVNRELLVVALGAGSLFNSHVNDGGFWFVKEYLNLTVPQALQTWTVFTCVNSILALAIVLLLDFFL